LEQQHPERQITLQQGHEQPGEVEVVVEGGESHFPGLLREPRYLLLSR
jgi:hypothetical protein